MTEAPERFDWVWYGVDVDGNSHVSFGRWKKHQCQFRYKFAEPQPTEHDHRADLVDPAAKSLDEHTALAIREAALRDAAYVAFNACLVPPDGGNPTEEERLVCDEASRRILALIQVSASQNDKKAGLI